MARTKSGRKLPTHKAAIRSMPQTLPRRAASERANQARRVFGQRQFPKK